MVFSKNKLNMAQSSILGYYHKPEETEKALKTHSDGKVWLHTGDIGYIDEDGFLFITNRIKRIIIRNDGCKVYPSNIESKIINHQAAKQCVAVGINDRRYSQGKLPFVYVILNDNKHDDIGQIKEELFKICIDSLPSYSIPVRIEFVNSFPKTRIGKINYRALEKQAEEMSNA